jgi:hypothetical protein
MKWWLVMKAPWKCLYGRMLVFTECPKFRVYVKGWAVWSKKNHDERQTLSWLGFSPHEPSNWILDEKGGDKIVKDCFSHQSSCIELQKLPVIFVSVSFFIMMPAFLLDWWSCHSFVTRTELVYTSDVKIFVIFNMKSTGKEWKRIMNESFCLRIYCNQMCLFELWSNVLFDSIKFFCSWSWTIFFARPSLRWSSKESKFSIPYVDLEGRSEWLVSPWKTIFIRSLVIVVMHLTFLGWHHKSYRDFLDLKKVDLSVDFVENISFHKKTSFLLTRELIRDSLSDIRPINCVFWSQVLQETKVLVKRKKIKIYESVWQQEE